MMQTIHNYGWGVRKAALIHRVYCANITELSFFIAQHWISVLCSRQMQHESFSPCHLFNQIFKEGLGIFYKPYLRFLLETLKYCSHMLEIGK